MLFSEITKSQLYRHQRSQRTWQLFLEQTCLKRGSKLQNTNSTETFILAAVIIRRQVACEQIQ